jgi:hypothetical protein
MADSADELRQKILRRKAVIVLGAGVTAGATNGDPVSTWTGLLANGVTYCEQHVGGLSPGWAERARADIASGDPDDLIVAAEKITRKLATPGNLADWLQGSIGELRLRQSSVLDAVTALGLPIITTNYDSLLEAHTRWPPVTWHDDDQARRVLADDEPGVVHLHGFFKAPETVVLDIRSYERILNNKLMRTMLEGTAYYRSFVFIGFGAGLEDPNFTRLRGWMREVLARLTNRHYRLCTNGQMSELAKVHHEDAWLRLVPFGDANDDLAPFLESLAPAAWGLDPALASAQSAPPTSEVTGPAGAVATAVRRRQLTTVAAGAAASPDAGATQPSDETIRLAMEKYMPELVAALQKRGESA